VRGGRRSSVGRPVAEERKTPCASHEAWRATCTNPSLFVCGELAALSDYLTRLTNVGQTFSDGAYRSSDSVRPITATSLHLTLTTQHNLRKQESKGAVKFRNSRRLHLLATCERRKQLFSFIAFSDYSDSQVWPRFRVLSRLQAASTTKSMKDSLAHFLKAGINSSGWNCCVWGTILLILFTRLTVLRVIR